MRLAVLPLLLLSAAVARAVAPAIAAEPPRPVVVLVHGRGQLGADTAALRRDWKRHLDTALGSAGFAGLRDEDVRLAWYADVLDPANEGSCERRLPADENGVGSMVRGFLVSLVSVMPDSGPATDRDARSLIGDMLYVVDPATRCAAESRLGAVLRDARGTGRPVIVVAYSLGAIVAYEYLARMRADSAAAPMHLITIGSPLGMPVARELLSGSTGELRAPAAVSRWVNLYDRDDAFAASLGLGHPAVSDRELAAAPTGDPHWVERYLRDAATGRALGESLCVLTANGWGSRCVQVGPGR